MNKKSVEIMRLSRLLCKERIGPILYRVELGGSLFVEAAGGSPDRVDVTFESYLY